MADYAILPAHQWPLRQQLLPAAQHRPRPPYEEAAAQRQHERGHALGHARNGVAAVAKVPGKGLQHEVGARQRHQEVVPLQRHPVTKVLLDLRHE